ncbi:MAG: DedA family protein [Limisphaerales bacterium]
MIAKLLEAVAGWVTGAISAGGYPIVALFMAIESACIPLPSEIIMPFAGFLVHEGRFSIWGATLAGAIGNLIGSVITYWVGYYGGRAAVVKWGKYILFSERDLNNADRFFQRYGSAATFFSRMLPIIRTFISLPAGISRMKFWPFAIFSFLGAIPWCWFLTYIGVKLGQNWNTIGQYLHKFDYAVAALILLGIAWYLHHHLKPVLAKKRET